MFGYNRNIRIRFSQLECWALAVLAIAYYLLNMIFPYNDSLEIQVPGRVFPQIAGALLSIYCITISLFNSKLIFQNRYLTIFSFFAILALCYIVYPFKPVENLKYVLRVFFAVFYLLGLYVLLVKNRRLALKTLYLVFLFQVLFGIYNLVLDRVIFEYGLSNIQQFDSNSGFIILCCVPLSLTIPQKRLRLYTYFLLVLACFYTGQRSAALAAVVSFPFCISYLKPCIKKIDIIFIFILILLSTPLFIDAVQNIVERNTYDLEKGEDIGSGRSVFWKITWDSYVSQDIFHILFGNGINSIVPVLEKEYGLAIGAHNGWLDILYTFGILGLLLYFQLIFGMLIRNGLFKRSMQYRGVYLILFIVFFVKCTTSHGYFDINAAPFCAMIAVLESNRCRQTNQNRRIFRGRRYRSKIPDGQYESA